MIYIIACDICSQVTVRWCGQPKWNELGPSLQYMNRWLLFALKEGRLQIEDKVMQLCYSSRLWSPALQGAACWSFPMVLGNRVEGFKNALDSQ